MKDLIRNIMNMKNPIGNIFLQILYLWNHRGDRPRRKYSQFLKSNKDKSTCLIVAREVGFFSLYLQVLEQIIIFEKMDIRPMVYFNKLCVYWDDVVLSGHGNVWDYFFEPVSNLTLNDVINSGNKDLGLSNYHELEIAVRDDSFVSDSYFGYIIPQLRVSAENRAMISKVLRRRIVLKGAIKSEIESLYSDLFEGNNVLGVHIRGKEKYGDLHFSYYGYLPIEYYFREIDAYLRTKPHSLIYLATDSDMILTEVQKKYPNIVIHNESARSAKEFESVHLAGKRNIDLAKQVITDAYMLSKCDKLIHGISNVPFAAAYINEKISLINIYEKYRIKSFIIWLSGTQRPKLKV